MVRLGDRNRHQSYGLIFDFNSTMVRLGVGFIRKPINYFHPFQFHYGAVGSFWKLFQFSFFGISIPLWCGWESIFHSFICKYIQISIPLWCGWESVWTLTVGLYLIFQFHYGAVGSSFVSRNNLCANKISIPLWCGWELTLSKLQSSKTLFQFHYGAVGSKDGLFLSIVLNTFQFHYGAVGRAWQTKRSEYSSYFNSTMVRLGEKQRTTAK